MSILIDTSEITSSISLATPSLTSLHQVTSVAAQTTASLSSADILVATGSDFGSVSTVATLTLESGNSRSSSSAEGLRPMRASKMAILVTSFVCISFVAAL